MLLYTDGKQYINLIKCIDEKYWKSCEISIDKNYINYTNSKVIYGKIKKYVRYSKQISVESLYNKMVNLSCLCVAISISTSELYLY